MSNSIQLSQTDMQFLNTIGALSLGSREGSEGGAGYVGAITNEDGKIHLTKMLTHHGERSAVAKDGGFLNHLKNAPDSAGKTDAIKNGTEALYGQLAQIADKAKIDLKGLLAESLKKDKLVSGKDITTLELGKPNLPALLSRKFLASAVTSIVDKMVEGGSKAFWSGIKHSGTIKHSAFEARWEPLKGARDDGKEVFAVTDEIVANKIKQTVGGKGYLDKMKEVVKLDNAFHQTNGSAEDVEKFEGKLAAIRNDREFMKNHNENFLRDLKSFKPNSAIGRTLKNMIMEQEHTGIEFKNVHGDKLEEDPGFDFRSEFEKEGSLTGMINKNPFDNEGKCRLSELRNCVMARLFKLELETSIQYGGTVTTGPGLIKKIGSPGFDAPLTELGRERLLSRALNCALMGTKLLMAAIHENSVYTFELPKGVKAADYLDGLVKMVCNKFGQAFRDPRTAALDTEMAQSYARGMFTDNFSYYVPDITYKGLKGHSENDYELGQISTNAGSGFQKIRDMHMDMNDDDKHCIESAFDKGAKNIRTELNKKNGYGENEYGEYLAKEQSKIAEDLKNLRNKQVYSAGY